MKGGTLDIESYPGSWRTFADNTYEARLMREVRPNMPASFSFKPFGKNSTITRGVWQYKHVDAFMQELWEVFDQNDFIIGHNVKRFDNLQSNTFFAQFGLGSPSKCDFQDTLKIAKANFRLPSYSLKYCLRFFGIGSKMETGGEELWFACESGDEKAQAKMLRYNRNDTVQTEKLYQFFLENGWVKNPPWAKYFTRENGCPRCQSHNVQKRGPVGRAEGIYQIYSCNECGKRGQGELVSKWPQIALGGGKPTIGKPSLL